MAGLLAKAFWWTASLPFGARYRRWRGRKVALQRLRLFAPASPKGKPRPPLIPSPRAIIIPASETPIVSIIISTYGQVDFTLLCLSSIMASAPTVPLEVVLVDDAYPGPEDVSRLREIPGIIFTRNETNLGFLLSCNRAAALAKGRYLYMLNNDTELLPGAIDQLVQTLEARPDVGLVGSKLIFADGSLQEAGGILWGDGSGWNFGRGGDPARPEFNYPREVDYCSGASIMLARALFTALGGFDPAYAPAYYEDSDLAMRIRARGLKTLYVPRSVVIHHEGKSHGTDTKRGVKAYQATNQAKFAAQWGAVLRRDHFAGPHDWPRARDHGKQRKLILIIDRYAPEPDRDAGSRSVLGIIECLIGAGWIVKLWSHERGRTPVYAAAVEQMGVEVLDERWPGSLSAWLAENGAGLDHVLISRPTIARAVLSAVKAGTRAPISFYGHDLHFARLRRQAMYAQAPQQARKFLAKAAAAEKMERRIWGRVDLVLYPSETETIVVREVAPWALAKTITPFFFPIAEARTPPPQRALLFVAGFAHLPNVDAAHFLVCEIRPVLEKMVGPVSIILAGANPTDAVRALAGPNVEVTGYISDEALARLYAQARVAIVPLRFGAGVKGKVVEALSHGLPLVTTRTGAQGIPGLEAVIPVHDEVAAIARALALLLQDDEAWQARSDAQRAFARAHFSAAAMQKSVLEAFEAVAATAKSHTGELPLKSEMPWGF
ncbi:glycosyltransferase [Acidocella sp.]|uniref:glycosyltransferase n=1 Tax=Acidocella sp. TaxID=50710 RepID=UPI002620EA75|nr:glycosyltransferase [Acidocella sp.]